MLALSTPERRFAGWIVCTGKIGVWDYVVCLRIFAGEKVT